MDCLKGCSAKKKKKPKQTCEEEGGDLRSLRLMPRKDAERIQMDRRTANCLIKQHEPFIRSIAGLFINTGVPFDELVQCGREGFYRAAIRYRGQYGVKLTSYAYRWVYGAMMRQVESRIREQREPVETEADLGERMDRYVPRSADASLLFPQQPNPETIVLFRELANKLRKKLYRLTHRQRLVVCRVTGFMDRKGPQTMEELAGQLDVSKEAIHDSKKHALQRLRISEAYLTEIATAEELMQGYRH